jgi:SAM-dependent methyltransferase
MLEFDAETTKILDAGYQGADIASRRHANLSALDPKSGQSIVDIGSGTGLLSMDMSPLVGDGGTIFAIDPSREMRTAAVRNCRGQPNIRVLEGTAYELPFEDESLDGAISLQVFEYLDDVPRALKEAFRVLKAGGRLIIGDLHWDSHIWHADNYERMQQMLRIWDRHMVWRRLPAYLPAMLRDTGFTVEEVKPVLCQDNTYRPDGLARLMVHLISAYAAQNKYASAEDVDQWKKEQDKLAEEGRFFFAITHYVTAAIKNRATQPTSNSKISVTCT